MRRYGAAIVICGRVMNGRDDDIVGLRDVLERRESQITTCAREAENFSLLVHCYSLPK